MRVLFTLQPAVGHFHPVAPLARALIEAGHEVIFATSASMCSTIQRAGFACRAVGLDWLTWQILDVFPFPADIDPADRPRWRATHVLAGVTVERALPDLQSLAREWRPDAVVHTSIEYAGYLLAERLDIAHVEVDLHFRSSPAHRRDYAAALDGHRARLGLPPDPAADRLVSYLHLLLAPPRFPGPSVVRLPTTHYLRPVPFDRAGDDEALPPWASALGARPVIYATLGTVTNDRPAVFASIIEGLRDLPVDLVVTVGHQVDPARFGPQPANVHIERYIPQTLLLDRCDAVVTHGGFGTMIAALLAGLPLVCLPQQGDQRFLAERGVAVGAAAMVAQQEMSPETIRAAVERVLHDPGYRERARGMGEEIAALPGLEHGVALLERVARDKQPVLAEP